VLIGRERLCRELGSALLVVQLEPFNTPTHFNSEISALRPRNGWESHMHLSNQSLLVIILVGIVAGWLAGRVMEGGGFGLIGDLLVGLLGAFIGDWLLPRLGIHLGVGIVAAILNAFIGAVVLLLLLRLVSGGFGYRRRSW
jgi:uncharacterized membrane protein YeaQ/YmgE (transglycosylase-associated protein family)